MYIKFFFTSYKNSRKKNVLKNTKIFTNKAFIKKQEDAIFKYINRFNKNNMFACL